MPNDTTATAEHCQQDNVSKGVQCKSCIRIVGFHKANGATLGTRFKEKEKDLMLACECTRMRRTKLDRKTHLLYHTIPMMAANDTRARMT